MSQLKHIGKMKNTGSKVVVAFRTVPGESNMALVISTATLPDAYHDSMMTLLQSDQGQDTFEFGEIMHIRHFPDGRPMLAAMGQDGRLQKVPTDTVIMTPAINSEVPLDQLNVLIAEQRGVAVDELCNFVSGSTGVKKTDAEVKEIAKVEEFDAPAEVRAQASTTEPLTDLDLAKSYRSQADSLYKEAARLRKQADELDPPKKKTLKVETESA